MSKGGSRRNLMVSVGKGRGAKAVNAQGNRLVEIHYLIISFSKSVMISNDIMI